jgi:hypothetical protein
MMVALAGCSSEEEPQKTNDAAALTIEGCTSCHDVSLDDNHQLACTACHAGDESITEANLVHQGVEFQPAHPDRAGRFCGPCHRQQIGMVQDNSHYTLTGHIQAVRSAFGAEPNPATAASLESYGEPDTVLQLVDDLLRRRCLRCHVYYEGDDFPLVRRATGCGACHLEYKDQEMASHRFLAKPTDTRCLSCHYGNHVGFDYYGRYEQDFNEEYRTPYTAPKEPNREYGVEYHQLEPDIHQQAGLVCIDCHSISEVMGSGAERAECRSCHDRTFLEGETRPSIRQSAQSFTYTSPATGKTFTLPVLAHPAHEIYTNVSCQTCHGTWTYNDGETHLLRLDHDEFDDFYKLTLDGSSEVNTVLHSHFSEDGEILDTMMSDKFTLEQLQGIWFKGFSERRWEQRLYARDEEGRIAPARPILDLHLSWIDEDEELRFDNVAPLPEHKLNRTYVPHTTGKAGLFYEQRLIELGVVPGATSRSVEQ